MSSKENIRINSMRRMEEIENNFSTDIPKEIMNYYLLNFLIVNGVRRYVDCHGLYTLDKEFCESGKELAGFGQLSFFEKDCIKFLSDFVEQEELSYERSNNRQLTLYRS